MSVGSFSNNTTTSSRPTELSVYIYYIIVQQVCFIIHCNLQVYTRRGMEILQIPIAYVRYFAIRVVLETNDTIVVPASLITMVPTCEPLNTERAHVPVLNVFREIKNVILVCEKIAFSAINLILNHFSRVSIGHVRYAQFAQHHIYLSIRQCGKQVTLVKHWVHVPFLYLAIQLYILLLHTCSVL